MQVHTLCAHTEINVRTFTFRGEEYTFETCADCGLSADTPAITASGPGELLPWWDWKPIAGKRITDARPGINRVQAQRTAARDRVLLLQELVEYEHELGETSTLVDELEAAKRHRASLGHVFVAG